MGCLVSKGSRRGAGVRLAPAAETEPKPADAACATSAAAALPPVVPFPPRATSGWPAWLAEAAGDALDGWSPRRADSFQKLDKAWIYEHFPTLKRATVNKDYNEQLPRMYKWIPAKMDSRHPHTLASLRVALEDIRAKEIGQGTYSNVYKARDLVSGKVVALKKVRFDIMESESVRFMAREISVLRRLNHPNVVRLEGLVTSRVSNSIYLIFEYMEHDLAGLVASPDIKFTEPQVKCYMKQLLSGLEHCHNRGVLHRDIKGSNLLLDNEGILKIADFGLASTFDPDHKQSMTSRVVTLWYRPPELLLGATYYGVGVDLWSAGCILGELLSGKPILPGRTEVEQLHKIFKLCGSPGDKYWKKAKLPHATMFKPNQAYKRCVAETFKDFSPSALLLIETLLAVDPAERGTSTAALNSEFFSTEPYACEPSTLPHYPPSKELDARLRDEKARRQRRNDVKGKAQGRRKARVHDHLSKAVPAPEANAELQVNLNRRMMARMNVTTQSEKFPPPHQDGAVGITTASFVAYDASFTSSLFEEKVEVHQNGPRGTDRKNGARKEEPQTGTSRVSIRHLRNSSIGLLMELRKSTRIHRKNKDKELEVFGANM